MLGIASGAIAGLVAITPASGFVGPGAAIVIGAAGGAACFWGTTGLKRALRLDDSLDVFGVHGVGGITGALLTGLLADPGISGLKGSIGAQFIGVTITAAYGLAVSLVLFKLIDRLYGLRVTEDEERTGLDVALHGESVE